MVDPRTSELLKRYYEAGAHTEALAQAFALDRRTVREALRREGVILRPEPPLLKNWREGLNQETIAALEAFARQYHLMEHQVLHEIRRTAWDGHRYRFPSREVLDALLAPLEALDSALEVARRLGVELNRALLAQAEAVTGGSPRRRRRQP